MKLSILFCITITNISFSRVSVAFGFIPSSNKSNIVRQLCPKIKTIHPSLHLQENRAKTPIKVQIQEKINSYQRWIRYKNIAPTIVLCFAGGWILQPTISLLYNRLYWLSTIETLFIMMTSMMINDVFDIEIDKRNHPNRPLITGEISRKEAIFSIFIMTGLIEIVNSLFFPEFLQTIVHLSVFAIFTYTPIFKKITIIKNIFCAGLVSFSLFFSGLSVLVESREWITVHPNFDLFAILFQIIFFGSFLNELALDILDYEGDKWNNILTIPVVFGKNIAWYFLFGLFGFNLFSSTLSLMYVLQGNPIFGVLPILFSIGIPRIIYIPQDKFSRSSINNTTEIIQTILILLVIYFCGLSTFR